MNHLDGIQNVLKGSPSAKLVENARKLFKEVKHVMRISVTYCE